MIIQAAGSLRGGLGPAALCQLLKEHLVLGLNVLMLLFQLFILDLIPLILQI
jgi:hypothetical protein